MRQWPARVPGIQASYTLLCLSWGQHLCAFSTCLGKDSLYSHFQKIILRMNPNINQVFCLFFPKAQNQHLLIFTTTLWGRSTGPVTENWDRSQENLAQTGLRPQGQLERAGSSPEAGAPGPALTHWRTSHGCISTNECHIHKEWKGSLGEQQENQLWTGWENVSVGEDTHQHTDDEVRE